MSDYSPYFHDQDHALAVGIIVGALMRAAADKDSPIDHVQPFTDAQRNYTDQLQVTVFGKSYTITVEDSLDEILRQDEAGVGTDVESGGTV